MLASFIGGILRGTVIVGDVLPLNYFLLVLCLHLCLLFFLRFLLYLFVFLLNLHFLLNLLDNMPLLFFFFVFELLTCGWFLLLFGLNLLTIFFFFKFFYQNKIGCIFGLHILAFLEIVSQDIIITIEIQMGPNENLINSLGNNNAPWCMNIGRFLISNSFIIKHKKLFGINFGCKYLHKLLILKILQGTHRDLLIVSDIHEI